MKIIWIIILILLASIFLGCVGKQPVTEPLATPTPSPNPSPTPSPTPQTTIVPTQTPENTPYSTSPVQYRSWIDSDYGFYKVRAVKDNASYQLASDFDTRNFSINKGDTVRWINDDMFDFSFTLVSNEGLWTGRTAFMQYQGQRFEYTFNKTGIYTFYVKEFPKLAPQKITVK
jgi:plastocyanin